jgi:hypothetical protein
MDLATLGTVTALTLECVLRRYFCSLGQQYVPGTSKLFLTDEWMMETRSEGRGIAIGYHSKMIGSVSRWLTLWTPQAVHFFIAKAQTTRGYLHLEPTLLLLGSTVCPENFETAPDRRVGERDQIERPRHRDRISV